MVAERGYKSTKRTHYIHQLRKKFVHGRPIRKFSFHERRILHERTVRRLKVPKAELIANTKPVEIDRDILNITEDIDLPVPRQTSRLTERGRLLRLGTLKPLSSEQTLSYSADQVQPNSINTVKRIVRERIKPPIKGHSNSIATQTTPDRTNQSTQTSLSFNLPAIVRSQYGSLGNPRDHQVTILCHEFLLQIQAIYDSNQNPQSTASFDSSHSNIPANRSNCLVNPPIVNNQVVQRPVVNYYTANPPTVQSVNPFNQTNSNQPNTNPYAGLTRNQIKRIKYLERKSKRVN